MNLINRLTEKANHIREKTIQYRRITKTPHIGSDLSSVEILTVLYYNSMKDSDSFILSKGHACGVLYSILQDKGKIPQEVVIKLEEHPTLNPSYGLDATTGCLGHGLSLGLGMAIADPINSTYVLMGDGECDEGQIWEAARLGSELNIKNLIGIVDCNGWQGFKTTNHSLLDRKFNSFGWDTLRCDGHSINELIDCYNYRSDKPMVILANTIKGKGIKNLENKLESHYNQVK